MYLHKKNATCLKKNKVQGVFSACFSVYALLEKKVLQQFALICQHVAIISSALLQNFRTCILSYNELSWFVCKPSKIYLKRGICWKYCSTIISHGLFQNRVKKMCMVGKYFLKKDVAIWPALKSYPPFFRYSTC